MWPSCSRYATRARHQPCEAIARFARAQQRVSAADDREHWHPQRRELFVGANRDALQPRTKVREHRRHHVHQHGGHFPSRDDRKRSPQPPRAAHSQEAEPDHRELVRPADARGRQQHERRHLLRAPDRKIEREPTAQRHADDGRRGHAELAPHVVEPRGIAIGGERRARRRAEPRLADHVDRVDARLRSAAAANVDARGARRQ